VIRRRAIVGSLAAAAALWLLGLGLAGLVLEGQTRRRIAERIADSLQAEATIDRGDLALVRGSIDLAELAVRRDDLIGHLAITVATLSCELPPLGLALVDRDCRDLAIRGPRLELSTAALFKLRPPKRPPLHARHVVIDDARVELSPSALLPSLGRVVVAIAHAEAGDTTFKTPLSWLFALRALDATVDLPGGITLHLAYDHGELRAAGGMFGATPIALPVALPVAELADDPAAELAKLVALGRALAEQVTQQLIERKAADWLRSKLPWP
jgi:hypothetical protein